MGLERIIINDLEQAEIWINILHQRSIRDKTELEILTATVDLLTTPRWRIRSRRSTRRWIAVLANEMRDDGFA